MSIDAALGRLGNKSGVCTSSTRPTNPYSGQLIYETDTNRTLVYDNAAWLVVADNQVLSIDTANGRVGVGTTSPATTLDIDGPARSENIVLDRNGITDTTPAIDIEYTGTSSAYNYFLRAYNDTNPTATMFVNGTTRTADGGVSAMTIRNDNGPSRFGNASYATTIEGTSVTTPGQPSFKAYTNAGQINNPTPGYLVFNNTSYGYGHNIGNAYNTSNGLFTAPVNGVYHFGAAMLTNNAFSSETWVRIWWRVNGVDIHHFAHNHTGAWVMESGSIYLLLNSGDSVGLWIDKGSGHYGQWSYFSGRLAG